MACAPISGPRSSAGARISSSGLARYLPWRAFSAIGHHVAAAWVALVYLVWALGVPGGAVLLTRGVLVTVIGPGRRCARSTSGSTASARRPAEATGCGGHASRGRDRAAARAARWRRSPPPGRAVWPLARAACIAGVGAGRRRAGWPATPAAARSSTASRIAVIGAVVLAAAKLDPDRRRALHRRHRRQRQPALLQPHPHAGQHDPEPWPDAGGCRSARSRRCRSSASTPTRCWPVPACSASRSASARRPWSRT